MRKITGVTVLEGYKLELTFDDGQRGSVDLSRHAGRGVFAMWDDPSVFRSVEIGPAGELIWGALYLEATGKNPEEIFPSLAPEDVNA